MFSLDALHRLPLTTILCLMKTADPLFRSLLNPFLFPLPQVLFMILIYSQLFMIVRVFTTSENSTINWAASPSP